MIFAIASLLMQTGFLDRSLTVGATTYHYQVYVPKEFDASRARPVILALHGSGERGTDGRKQTKEGIGPAIRAHPERFPAIVVMPQAPPDRVWLGEVADAAMRMLDS